MVDRDKVIKGLECCSKGCSRNCPYFEIDGCNALLDNDAIALLKEQEGKIEQLEHDLAVAQDDLYYYVNGND